MGSIYQTILFGIYLDLLRDISSRFLKAKVFYQLCPFHWLLTFKACFHILQCSKTIQIDWNSIFKILK